MTNDKGLKRPQSLRDTALIGLSAAMLVPGAAFAQEVTEASAPIATVTVEDTAIDPNPNAQLGVPYKARTSGDSRHSRPLAETPQTINVLTHAQIRDSGYTDMSQILSAQPGVTLGTGENGNAFGDRFIIRGQEARSDVFVDGLRDPGMSTRESFAVEQIEISKGPNSSFAGRGTAGGAINSITKQATSDENFGRLDVGVGTDQFIRVTGDVNYAVTDTLAIRANGLLATQDIPDRSPAKRERKGFALTMLYQPTTDLSVTLDYYGLRAKDRPDMGTWLEPNAQGTRRPFVNSPVFAQEQDFQRSNIDTFTGRVRYTFSDNVRISNITRYGMVDNGYLTTGANGANATFGDAGLIRTATLSTHQGWQDVKYLASQTNLYIDSALAGGQNQLILGAEYSNHKVRNGVYRNTNTGTPNCRTGNNLVNNAFCAMGPDGQAVNGLNTLLGRQVTKGNWDTDWKMETISAYVLDTLDLTTDLTIFAGLRMDHIKFNLVTQNTTTLVQRDYGYSDTLWNGYVGVTYKLGEAGMVYVSAATAADANGGESDVGTSSGYGGLIIFDGSAAGASPERSVNLELGTKWNLFDEKLLLTAALFQATKSDVMEGADYTEFGTFNTGKNRIRGIELGVVGNVNERWTLQAGATFMKSEILESTNPANIGKMLSNFANNSFQAQTRYQFTEKVAMGIAAKYQSSQGAGQPDSAAAFATNPDGSFYYSRRVPSHIVGDFFAEFHLAENVELMLNVNNITNADYYLAAYRSGAFVYKGDGRSVRGTLSYAF